MILRLSDSLARGLIVVSSVLLGLWLSFFGIRAAIARYGVEANTANGFRLAVRLEPENPNYWYFLGRYQQDNLEQSNSAIGVESYRKAIALNPLATNAWLELGMANELDGKLDQARDAYLEAKESYPGSAEVSWRYGNFLLRQGQQVQAYTELRRAIEADPRRAAPAFSRAYRSNPDLDEILQQLLPARPGVYVSVISEAAGSKQLAVAQTVWTQLIALNPRLDIREVDYLASELVQAGDLPAARRVWDQGVSTMNLPPLLEAPGSVMWDPSFESGINGYSFSWHFVPIAQFVSIGLDRSERLSGHQSLRLSFDGKHNPDLEAACAMGIVQPGTTYHFSGWIKTRDVTTENGVGFRVRSIDDGSAPVLNTREFHGTNPWTSMDQNWTAGPHTHRVQVCVVRDPSDNPAVRISGTAWVDDVNLVPEPPGRHKP
jgi:cytochrome c-type biogenesis protein CcmH/NrfG